MANLSYSKRVGDRRDGRQLRSLTPVERCGPYFMRRRSDACNGFADTMEVSEIEQWLLAKRAEGWKNMGLTHLLVAAYVRTVSMRPGINRFVAGRRIFARHDLSIVLSVKNSLSDQAGQASVKVSFSPTDTVFDVYRRLTDAIDEAVAGGNERSLDRMARTLSRMPRFLQRWANALLRLMDYYDWLPRRLVDVSPFHASLAISDMGSLGIQPIAHHIYDFGNIPCFFSYGAKKRVNELDREGNVFERHYVDYRITCDERIADAAYYAGALKCFKYFLKNPALLELPPERIEDDVN